MELHNHINNNYSTTINTFKNLTDAYNYACNYRPTITVKQIKAVYHSSSRGRGRGGRGGRNGRGKPQTKDETKQKTEEKKSDESQEPVYCS